MDGDETDLSFDMSEWTVVDDVSEEKAGGDKTSSSTTTDIKKTTTETLVKSKIDTSSTNQTASNNTGLATTNPAKSTVQGSSSVAAKNVVKPNTPSTSSDTVKNVVKPNTPSTSSDTAKNVVKPNTPSDSAKNVVRPNTPSTSSDTAKNVVRPNTPSSANNPAKNVVKPNTPSDSAKNVVRPNTPSTSSDTAKNVVKPNTPSDSAKNVVKPNTTSTSSEAAKNVVKPNTPSTSSEAAKNVVKPNTPSTSSDAAKNVVKPNTLSDAAKNVVKPNMPSTSSEAAKNVVKPNTTSTSSDAAKNVVKPNTPSDAAKNVVKPNTPSDAAKNVVKPNTPSNVNGPAKSVATPTSGGPNAAAKNAARPATPSRNTTSSNNLSNPNGNKMLPTKNPGPNESAGAPPAKTAANTAANTSNTNKPGGPTSVSGSQSGNNSQLKTPVFAASKSSNEQKQNPTAAATTAPRTTVPKQDANTVASSSSKVGETKKVNTNVKPTPPTPKSNVLVSNSPKIVPGSNVTSTPKPGNTPAGNKPSASTIKTTGQVPSQTTSQEQLKNKAQISDKANQVGSIADVMEAVSKKNNNENDMENISDTELTDGMDIAKYLVSKVAGVKREALPSKDSPSVKKAKIQTYVPEPSQNQGVKQNQNNSNQSAGVTASKGGPVKQQQSGKADESTVNKGSFGAVKTVAAKTKSQTSIAQSTPKANTTAAANKTIVVENRSGIATPTTPGGMPVKRIIHRFHRMTQTVPSECSNKLLQCLIRIPSIDGAPKHKSNFAIQTVSDKPRHEVFYQKALPDMVRPEVFKVVSSFSLSHPGGRNIITGSFDYGISLGHITAADMEKSLFKENLLSKCAHYSLHFDRQDFGVLDLLFAEEEPFLSVVTHIRKMKIGPRHLVVTYCKNISEKERDPGSQLSCVKATIIYNQNFASTGFLTHAKAPLWNKPKVEETMTVHNMPGGIPVDFLKLIIPDAITIEMDDKKQKFTQDGSRVRLGMNRKNGGDRFLKLFAQMYINNECLVLSVAGTTVPELADILKEKEKRQKEKRLPAREVKAVARDISTSTNAATAKDEADVFMHVETVANVDKVLTGQTAAWKGPSSVEKLKQVFATKSQPKATTVPASKTSSKEPALSDVSDFSDISDSSNVGEESSAVKRNQKRNANPRSQKKPGAPGNKTPKLGGKGAKSPNSRSAQRPSNARKPLPESGRSDQRKSSSAVSGDTRRRREQSDRMKAEDQFHSPSKQSGGRSASGSRDARQSKLEGVGRGRPDRTRSISRSSREKDSYRKNVIQDRGCEMSARDRLRLERQEVEKFNRNLYDGDGDSRHVLLDSGPERDHRKEQLNLEVNRQGIRIVSLWEKEGSDRKMRDVPDRLADKARHDTVGRGELVDERDGRKGERLDRLVQKRLGSLERQDRQSRGGRDSRLTGSPSMRRVQRGRSTSPNRRSSASHTSPKPRRPSPGPVAERFPRNRRSRSPLHRERGSAMGVGGDGSARQGPEGVWLSQPPLSDDESQQNVRKTSFRPGKNRAAPPADWKSTRSAHESEDEQVDTSGNHRLFEHFIERMIETSKSNSGEKHTPAHSGGDKPDKVFEKMQATFGNRRNAKIAGTGPNEDFVKSSAGSGRALGGGRSGGESDARVGSMPRSLNKLSVSPTHSRGSRGQFGHFEDRVNCDEEVEDEDAQLFEGSVDNRGRMYRRESDMGLSKPGSGPFRESGMRGNESGPFRESGMRGNESGPFRESGRRGNESGPLRESGMRGNESGPFRESGMRGNESGLFRESGMRGNESGPFREPGIRANESGPFREPGMMGRQSGSGPFRESGVMDNEPGSGPFREPGMRGSEPGSGPFREPGMRGSEPGSGPFREPGMRGSEPGSGPFREPGMRGSEPGSGPFREPGMRGSEPGSGPFREPGMRGRQSGPGPFREPGMMGRQSRPGPHRESAMMVNQSESESFREPDMMDESDYESYRQPDIMEKQSGSGPFREPGMMGNQSGSGPFKKSGMMGNQSGSGPFREAGMMGNQSGSGPFREAGMMGNQSGPYGEPGMMGNQSGSGPYGESGMMGNQTGSGPYGESGMMGNQSGPYGESGMMGNQSGPYGESGMMGNQSGPYGEPGMMNNQSGSGPYGESGMMGNQSGPYGEPGMMGNQSGSGPYGESGMMGNQTGSGPYGESGMMGNQSGPYGESGMMGNQSGPYGESGMMGNQTGSGPYGESGMMGNQSGVMGNQSGVMGNQSGMMGNQSSSGPYGEPGMMGNQLGPHQNKNITAAPPIPPPLTPPNFNSPNSSQDRIFRLEAMANMLAADIENNQNQPLQNAPPEMWNTSSQQSGFQMLGPPPPPPPMPFSGPNPSQDQNMNFSGPPPPFMPQNMLPPPEMYQHPPPWSHGNYF